MTASPPLVARRQLMPFAALSASYFAHIGFFNPYLPLWLKDLGYGLVAISLLTSVQSATRLFAPYAWGWLSDHTGERVKLLRWCASVAALAALGLYAQWGLVGLVAVLLLMFTHTSSMMPMSEAAMAHLVSAGGVFDARLYGRVRLWGSLGFLLTVFAAGAWFDRHGMVDFPGWAVATLLAVLASVWWLPDVKEAAHAQEPRTPIGPILRQPAVAWFFAGAFFHVLAHIGVYIFFSLFLDSLGYAKSVIGMLWGVSVVIEIAWFFTQSRWLPLLKLTTWLMVCSGAMVLRMGLTAAFPTALVTLVLAQMLHALTFAAHHSVCIAWLSQRFPARLRGRGMALYTVIAYGLTGVLGGLAGGLLSERLGLAAVYWASAGVGLLGMGCAWQAARWRAPGLAERLMRRAGR